MQYYTFSIDDLEIVLCSKHYKIEIPIAKKTTTKLQGCILVWRTTIRFPNDLPVDHYLSCFTKQTQSFVFYTEFNPLPNFHRETFSQGLSLLKKIKGILKNFSVCLPVDLAQTKLEQKLQWFIENNLTDYCQGHFSDSISPAVSWAIDSLLLLVYSKLFSKLFLSDKKDILINHLLSKKDISEPFYSLTHYLINGASNYFKIKVGSDNPHEDLSKLEELLKAFQTIKKKFNYSDQTLLFFRFDANKNWTLEKSFLFLKGLSVLLNGVSDVFVDYIEEPLTDVGDFSMLIANCSSLSNRFDFAIDESLLENTFGHSKKLDLSSLPKEIIVINKPNLYGGLKRNIELFLESLEPKRRFVVTSSFETHLGTLSLLLWVKLLNLHQEIHGFSTHVFISKVLDKNEELLSIKSTFIQQQNKIIID